MNIERIKSTLARGGEHLGDLVFWSLTDARVERSVLASLWAAAGLSDTLLPESPTAEKALKLAVRESHSGHADRLLRVAKDDDYELVFAVVRERRPGDGSLDYHTEARIKLDRQSESFSSDQPTHPLVETVKARFEAYRTTHHPDDVRRTLVKTLHSFAAVTLRDGGGVYWVPASFGGELRRLQLAIEQIGASRMYLLPIHKSADATRTLGDIAKTSMEEELAGLRNEIEQFLAVPPERPSTLMRRFDAFESLRNRAKLYRSALAIEVSDLDSQLDKLCATVEKLLHQKSAA